MSVMSAGMESTVYGTYEPIDTPVYHLGSWHGNCADEFGTEWIVTSEDGWSGSPARRGASQDRAQDDGSYAGLTYFGPRVVTLSGVALCQNRTQMLAAKRRFAAVASGRTPIMMVVEEEDLILQAAVRSTGENKAKDKGSVAFEWSLQVQADDPRKYEILPIEQGINLPDVTDLGGRTYPRTYPMAYAGPLYSGNGILHLDNPGSYFSNGRLSIVGAVNVPTVQHVEQGATLTLNANLAAGDVAVYDLGRKQVTINGTIRSDLLTSRGWFNFQPGTNTLLYRGSGDRSATLAASFYAAHI